jgi:dihydrofolate synthase / folylpolyglutamate synthase
MPPKDDLWAAVVESLPELKDNDIVLVSSKVVAIDQGRCLATEDFDKEQLIKEEAEIIIPRSYQNSPLIVKHHAFIGSAGIDESNGDGYYILLPEDIFAFAKEFQRKLREHFNLSNLGMVVVDSHSVPFRYGAMGVALGWWGIEPVQDHRGRTDLFGRKIQYERSNLVDGLAAGATVLMGEVDECIPLVIARKVPNVTFSDEDTNKSLFMPYEVDAFRILYEKFLD